MWYVDEAFQDEVIEALEHPITPRKTKVSYHETIQVINKEICLAKCISSPIGNDHDWEYNLKQLANPATERPIKEDKRRREDGMVYRSDIRMFVHVERDHERGLDKDPDYKITKGTPTTLLAEDACTYLFGGRDYPTVILLDYRKCRVKDYHIWECNVGSNSHWEHDKSTTKYFSISFEKLQERNREYRRQGLITPQNEIKAGMSYDAVIGVAAPNDDLITRVNTLYRQQMVKVWLGKEVPILILNHNNTPAYREYTFSEQLYDRLNLDDDNKLHQQLQQLMGISHETNMALLNDIKHEFSEDVFNGILLALISKEHYQAALDLLNDETFKDFTVQDNIVKDNTCLHYVVQNQKFSDHQTRLELIAALCRSGSNPGYLNQKQHSALNNVLYQVDVEALHTILLNVRDDILNKHQLGFLLASLGNKDLSFLIPEVVKTHQNSEAESNTDCHDNTVLHNVVQLACTAGENAESLIAPLIKLRISVSSRNNQKQTPLTIARQYKRWDIIEIFIDKACSKLDLQEYSELLVELVDNKNIDLLKKAIANRPNSDTFIRDASLKIHIQINLGRVFLRMIKAREYELAWQFLEKFPTFVNIHENPTGFGALEYCVLDGKTEFVSWMNRRGRFPVCMLPMNQSALSLAINSNRKQCALLMLEQNPNILLTDQHLQYCIMQLCEQGLINDYFITKIACENGHVKRMIATTVINHRLDTANSASDIITFFAKLDAFSNAGHGDKHLLDFITKWQASKFSLSFLSKQTCSKLWSALVHKAKCKVLWHILAKAKTTMLLVSDNEKDFLQRKDSPDLSCILELNRKDACQALIMQESKSHQDFQGLLGTSLSQDAKHQKVIQSYYPR